MSTNSSLSFDGINDYIQIVIDEPETEITHELWFKTTNPNTGIFSIMEETLDSAYDRDIYLKNGEIQARIYQNEVIKSGGLNLADGKWHHVTHVIGTSVGGQKLYVDGNLVASGTKAVSDFDWQKKAIIGFSRLGFNNYFDGQIDEVKIWNIALTQKEIQANIASSLTGNEENLIGYWNFNENSGEIVNDLTNNNNNGFIVDATWTNGVPLAGDTLNGDNNNNLLEGTFLNNSISGLDGNDTLKGFSGNDTLTGGKGNDQIDGGVGADVMKGNQGNDTYLVDNFGDIVTELANQGTDLVKATIDYMLFDNIENLMLVGNGKLNGTGNSLANSIMGNIRDNLLNSKDGNDTLEGFGGNDNLIGGDGKDNLIGGTGNDLLNGGKGADILNGGVGNDMLTGGSESDQFVLGRNLGTDTITDFQDGIDKIQLTNSLTFANLAFVNGTGTSIGKVSIIDSEQFQIVAIVNNMSANQFSAADFIS